ncbi:MAG: response regulator transcription factor [Candidatus Aminicenantales bacterium]
MKKILIIEDDEALLETLASALEVENFMVITATDGERGLSLALEEKPDLLVLDWVVPHLSGLEICRKLRTRGIKTPIIILSGKKKEEIDKVLGLELGADDFLVKPFGTKEFIARINALLRRATPEMEEIEECSFGDVSIHFKKQSALKGQREIHLTAKEFQLLRLLIAHEGEVVSRETILNEVWGYDKFPTTRTVDTFVHNLRKKIEDDPTHPVHLITMHWAGYKFIR